jgi:hypothetical protein
VFTDILNAPPTVAFSFKFAIVIDEIIEELPDGTVYNVDSTLADGFD